MKNRICKIITIMLALSFFVTPISSRFSLIAKADEKNPLKIEKIIGLSEKPGTFRMISQEGLTAYPFYQQGLAVAKDGTIYIGDDGEGQIEMFDANHSSIGNFGSLGCGDGQFQRLTALMIDDKDKIYAVDSYLARIQVFNRNGKFLRKFGNQGKQNDQLRIPTDIALLNSEELIIVDALNGIKVFSRDGQYIRNFSSHEFLIDPNQYVPGRVEVDANGIVYLSIYIGNSENYMIAQFDQQGQYLRTVLDENNAPELSFGYVPDIAVRNQYFYMVNINFLRSVCINRYEIPTDPTLNFKFVDKIGDTPRTDKNKINSTEVIRPTAVVAQNEKIYYLDGRLNRLVVVSEKLDFIGSIQSPILALPHLYQAIDLGSLPLGVLENPQGVRVDPSGRIFVGNNQYSCISVFDSEGKPITNFGKQWKTVYSMNLENKEDEIKPGDLMFPTDIDFDADGNIFVTDTYLGVVQIFDKNFEPKTMINGYFQSSPQGIAFDHNKNLLVVNSTSSTVSVLQNLTKGSFDYQLEARYQLEGDWPVGIDVDSNNNRIVSMAGENQIQVIDQTGELVKLIGEEGVLPGQMKGPQGVLVDGADNIYVAETENGRIQKFSPDGSSLWCQNLEWLGLTLITMDTKGKIYVTDCTHGVVLVLSDDTVVIPTPGEPNIQQSDADFSLSVDKEQVLVDDTFTLSVHVKKLEKTSSIELTLGYLDMILSIESCQLGELLETNSFQPPGIDTKKDQIILKSATTKQEINGSGILFKIKMKAKQAGLVLFDLIEINIRNSIGKQIYYNSKKGLSLLINEVNINLPYLNIKPLPEIVFDPMITIEGETDPGVQVSINQNNVTVSDGGKFSVHLQLAKGPNKILVVAIDMSGNMSQQTILVKYRERIIIKLTVGSKTMEVNGKSSILDSNLFIDKVSGRTLVPIRAITEALGATIEFEAHEQKIIITTDEVLVTLWIGKPLALVNGAEVPIDLSGKVSPVIVKGRTFVPLRFVAESFNFQVEWNPKKQEITLTYPKP